MKTKNKYRKSVHLKTQKIDEILRYFSEDLNATQTAKLLVINRNTINSWYSYIRHAIYWYCEKEKNEVLDGTIELDESYFGAKRVKGKRGRGAGMKTIVFGLLKRNGKVYAEIVPDAKAKTLKPIIRRKIESGSEINTDGWLGYDGLVDMGYAKHYRVHHGVNEFARGKQHINGIESFWSYLKRRFIMFNGVKKTYFDLYLQETVFRYNISIQGKNLKQEVLKLLRKFSKI